MKQSKRNDALKRVIVDYKKLNNNILGLIMEKYSDGYGDRDIISFRNAQGEWVECIEVKTEDTLYLVKVSKRLTMAIEEYDYESSEEEININESKDFEEE